MKNRFYKFIALLLIAAGIAASCNPEEKEKYPKDISFTEYSLPKPSCQWVNLPCDGKIIVIDSKAELEKYISCAEGSYPAIDFSKHSLLLASGKTDQKISSIHVIEFKQHKAQHSRLNIEINECYQYLVEKWCVALIVEKWSNKNTIVLDLSYTEEKNIFPVFISTDIEKWLQKFTTYYYFLPNREKCFFRDILSDTCMTINSVDEFSRAFSCSDESDLPEINFDNYTLVVGQKTERGYVLLENKWIIENDVLTLLVVKHGLHGTNSDLPMQFGGIYTKLPEKPLAVEYYWSNELKSPR